MSAIVEASIDRYHEKIAAGFIEDWVKKHIPLPSKEKARKYLKKHIKTEKDLDDLYKALPKMTTFLKSKKGEESSGLFPPGFVKNLAAVIAMLSILGNMYSKDRAVEKLRAENITLQEQVREYKTPSK